MRNDDNSDSKTMIQNNSLSSLIIVESQNGDRHHS